MKVNTQGYQYFLVQNVRAFKNKIKQPNIPYNLVLSGPLRNISSW